MVLEALDISTTREFESKRVLLICSSGGHLAQLLRLKQWWVHHERHWVTANLPDANSKLIGEKLTYYNYPTPRNIKNFLRNIPLARRVIKEWKPDIIVSNGSGVAVPFFLLAKIMRVPTVYMEVYDRLDSKTLSGRLCRPLATEFLVQWPEQQKLYKNSKLIGPIY